MSYDEYGGYGAPLSGAELVKRLEAFMQFAADEGWKIRRTDAGSGDIVISVLRSELLERWLDFISDTLKVSYLAGQHTCVLVFLKWVLLGNPKDAVYERVHGVNRIDLTAGNLRYELKTRSDVGVGEAGAFLSDFYGEMKRLLGVKDVWWFVFLLRRTDPPGTGEENLPNINKPVRCNKYMVVLRVMSSVVKGKLRKELEKEAELLMDEAYEIVSDEDRLRETLKGDKGILAPIKNFWVVEKLRDIRRYLEKKLKLFQEELKSAHEELQRQREELRKRDEELRKRDEELRKRDEELRKRDEELRKIQEELKRAYEEIRKRDRVIDELVKTVHKLEKRLDLVEGKTEEK